MERIAMSQRERDRLDWLKRARDEKMTRREAAEPNVELLGLAGQRINRNPRE